MNDRNSHWATRVSLDSSSESLLGCIPRWFRYSRFLSLCPDGSNGGPQSRVRVVQLLQSGRRSWCRVTIVCGHHVDVRMLAVRYRREIMRRWQTGRWIMQWARIRDRRWWYRTGWHWRALRELARSRWLYTTADRRRRWPRRRCERLWDWRRRFLAFLHFLGRRRTRVATCAASGRMWCHVLLSYGLHTGHPHRRHHRRNLVETVLTGWRHTIHHRTRRTVARVIHN